MKKIIMLCLLGLMTWLTQSVAAQNCSSTKDTVYLVLVQYELKNGRPVNSFFVLNNLSEIHSLQERIKQEDFLCWFYQNSNVFQFSEISDFSSCYSFKNKKAKVDFFRRLYKKQDKMNKNYTSFFVKDFSDVTSTLKLSCLKLYGDFWIANKETIISDQIYSEKCPHQSQQYNLKDIFQFWKLTEAEKNAIKFDVH